MNLPRRTTRVVKPAPDLAIEILEKAIKSHPDAAEIYFNLATLYAKNGPALGNERAITTFKQALRLDPHYDEARYSLAKLLVELGQFSDAVPYLMDYTRHKPNDAEGFRLLGSAWGLSSLFLVEHRDVLTVIDTGSSHTSVARILAGMRAWRTMA